MLNQWSVSGPRDVRTIKLSGHTKDVTSVTFSPDREYVLTGSQDDTVKLWDVAKGSEVRTFTASGNVVWAVAISPDGRQVASGCARTTFDIWDTETGRKVRTFEGYYDLPRSFQLLPDSRHVLSGSYDGTLHTGPSKDRLVLRE
jgi:WD40 repeat protein